jgi:CelD/BcsL family acetyltransferase involved in cellulose biosynthesis
VETHTSPDKISNDWKYLEEACPVSGYQARRWVEPWLRVVGRARNAESLFILARDREDSPALLFALSVANRSGLRVAAYAGDRDSNVNMPLLRPDVPMDATALRSILVDGARQAGVDAFALLNQPVEWRGVAHPLSALPGQPSPSFLHSTKLEESGEALLASRMNADGRKRMRWRLRKLEAFGPVSLLTARSPDEARLIIEGFRSQKKIRIDAMGAAGGFDVDLACAFMEAAALSDEPGVELHALLVGERVAAVYCGVTHGGRFHAMVNSYAVEREIARASPGEIITTLLLQNLCDRGFAEFDLGVGEAEYKRSWCERKESLFDTFVGVSARGMAYCMAQKAKLRTKRIIKQSPWLWSLAQKVRTRLGGRA